MSATLLSTKLSAPPLRPDLLVRPHLFERLDAALRLGHRLTLISATAGSGKTTLAATWLQHVDQPSGWLSLDRDDNDTIRFSTHLIAALQRIDGRIGQAAQGILVAQDIPTVEALMELLINDMAATASAFVLVLDDFHLIQAPAIHAMIAFLLDHGPPQLHLVLLTREDPPLPLPRLRAHGQLTELRAADLRFSAEEIARFLQQTHGLALGTDLVATLEARTEGWIAGVQLAALALHERADVAAYIDTFSGSNRYVVEYLAADVLQQLPEDLRMFLRQTAILEQLSAPLCDAVTERTDSAARLQQIEQANLFIIPLDDRGGWYRYYHLFAEFLRSTLRAEELPTLHRHAAEWYHAQGFWEQAIGHALASHDQKLAEDLIAQSAVRAIRSGRLTTLLGRVSLIEPLSRRESEILQLIASGMPNDAVAHALVIAPGTVKKHLDNIYGKLGAHNRTEAVARARQRNLL